MAQPDSPASLQACAIRVGRLAADGTPMAGPGNLYVSNQFVKLTWDGEYEAGQEFTTRNACGALVVAFKDRDVAKRYKLGLELSVPDPELEEIITGAATIAPPALTTPAAPTLAQSTVAGNTLTLLGTFQYQVTAFNGLGESLPNAAPVTVTLTTTNNTVTVTMPATQAGQTHWRIYGRSAGTMGLLATIPVSQTTFVDTGALAPGQAVPVLNNSSQTIGSIAPPLGVHPSVYNNGVSLEVWTKAIIGSSQATYLPWFHWVLPKAYLQVEARNAENADMKHMYDGWCTENPSYGQGPMNDWPAYAQPLTRAWGRFRSNDLPTNIQPGYQSALA